MGGVRDFEGFRGPVGWALWSSSVNDAAPV